jgi:cytochrome c oxidase assembly protein subunit 11
MAGQAEISNKSLSIRLGIAALAMFAFGFALVPLYDIFCEVTGIRSPIEANDASMITEQPELSRIVTLEMLASTNQGAPWEFSPVFDSLDVHTGLMQDIEYTALNLSNAQIIGVATPDIRPADAAKYFRKVECFCFNEQEFAANEERNMAVRFYIEPDLPAHINTITLAYTLFVKPDNQANKMANTQ